MRALFIGGTGTISMAISRLLVEQGWELYLLNRGSRKNVLDGQVKQIVADISKEQEVAEKIAGMNFDVVCDFIAFVPEQVERDYRLFAGKTPVLPEKIYGRQCERGARRKDLCQC